MEAIKYHTHEVYIGHEKICICEDSFNAKLVYESLAWHAELMETIKERGLLYAVRKLEGAIIIDQLDKSCGNRTEAAKNLGMKRTTLVEKLGNINKLRLV